VEGSCPGLAGRVWHCKLGAMSWNCCSVDMGTLGVWSDDMVMVMEGRCGLRYETMQ
jgi:hypothetical protein